MGVDKWPAFCFWRRIQGCIILPTLRFAQSGVKAAQQAVLR